MLHAGQGNELSPPPGYSGELPMFCRIAGVGYDLVLMGGWDLDSWKSSNSVLIYNFMSANWGRRADMPGWPTTFFACASDLKRRQGQFERSAEALDVAMCKWDPAEEEFLGSATCLRTGGDGGDGGRVYMCRGGEVVASEGGTWEAVVELPCEIREVAHMSMGLEGMLLVIGSSGYPEP
ncbi:F-box/kelch-repeat protein At1g15670-like [Neltuma alba]|uniref:F-box/kelch-repeat protein At1g15670-like n=1 Tax=Neltuma alba TaxID=207710 RepID=UPI0010A43C1A|nr:F-box/kelch-repeat protein At1g15670-like [Prosopis alba]